MRDPAVTRPRGANSILSVTVTHLYRQFPEAIINTWSLAKWEHKLIILGPI